MQWKANKWKYILFFFTGCLISYVLTQFYLLEIDYKVNIPEVLMGILGLGVGIFIVDTIQKNISRNQSKYSLLESKLDISWIKFINLSKLINVDDKIALEALNGIDKEIIHQISYLKNIFNGYDMECTSLDVLELKLEEFQAIFDGLKTVENIKYYQEEKPMIEEEIIKLNKCFSDVLNVIQKI